ncbi:OLC1v1000858C1, partial [Oldenlandia corymbosa var. corymbosa]
NAKLRTRIDAVDDKIDAINSGTDAKLDARFNAFAAKYFATYETANSKNPPPIDSSNDSNPERGLLGTTPPTLMDPSGSQHRDRAPEIIIVDKPPVLQEANKERR